ncbi:MULTISPECIES: SMC-Scp complex subunit ScpB [unclassified Lactobacillus]|uniref:SMC-Scp complex subunit ScpB n=1 Tax=unclassified Lactobacillus TaxID=2620435 RepID=UPI000EFD5459|nr:MULTISPECIES: SMC-Scp complex subunit ScpB [unclassified Lactobacillus]RMC25163.1 SMC-Scp complex subunit ScpB [Lactobacillus sp. ESL0247]RMC29317.1 SMC-Scp complex subunit ScpB [Lactobacillus sp. ESL0246]RMC32338.1 SMC-Scp complex subunit ScpB [Lactobacillus sp. ESL0245]
MVSKMAQLEALLYLAGDSGLESNNLCELLQIDSSVLRELSKKLKEKLKQNADTGLQVVHLDHSYKLTTRPEVSEIVTGFFQKNLTKTLSQSALEILSIIAYKQPITRVEIDTIRGVNSSGALQTLLWRGLIKIEGKKDVPGHPNLYITSEYFLQYFGYQSLADLPLIEDFEDDIINVEGEIDLLSAKGQVDKNLFKHQREGEK